MAVYNARSMDLPSDDDILTCLNDALDDNLTATQNWRQLEVRENFAMFEGNQWTAEAAHTQVANGMPTITINRVAPVLEAICGFEVQNRLDIHYAPRLSNEEQRGFNDVLNNTVKYIEDNAKAQSQYSLSFKDMLLCGVGVTNTSINYDNNSDGEVEVRRVFPAFIFWDICARAKNIIDANYVIELKVLDKDTILQEYDIDEMDDVYSVSTIDARVLEFFETILAVKALGVVYEYQWREKKPFYRVENPFKDNQELQMSLQMMGPAEQQAVMSLAQQMAEQFNFDPRLDGVFTVETKKELNDLKQYFQSLGIKLKFAKQKKFCYYRAIITGNKVISKAENYSQDGFSIKFMTGQFSELTQSYYGLGRSVRDPQRMLNQNISDYVGFMQSNPKGGVNIESDAVKNLDAFIQTYTKARNVTVFNPGALMGGKVMPKATAPLPAGILEMIQYADSQIMQVCGVTPEFMGIMSSKEMNSSFLRQQIKQGLTPLATYLDAKYTYLQRQANLYIDCTRMLAEMGEGRLIKNVIGEENAPYVPLLKTGIAQEYDVVVDEVPAGPDENKDIFMKILELQQAMPNKDLMPLAVKFLPLPENVVKELEEMFKPTPPPPPDPVNQQLLISQAELNTANAHKNMADAEMTKVDTALKANELRFAPAKEITDIEYTSAKTDVEKSKVHKTKHDIVGSHMSTMNNLHKTQHDMDMSREASKNNGLKTQHGIIASHMQNLNKMNKEQTNV